MTGRPWISSQNKRILTGILLWSRFLWYDSFVCGYPDAVAARKLRGVSLKETVLLLVADCRDDLVGRFRVKIRPRYTDGVG